MSGSFCSFYKITAIKKIFASLYTNQPQPYLRAVKNSKCYRKITLKLYNILGCIVLEKETQNNTTLHTTESKSGVYTLVSEGVNTKSVNKIVVSR